jgi:hypothetical protein
MSQHGFDWMKVVSKIELELSGKLQSEMERRGVIFSGEMSPEKVPGQVLQT